nr:hypothetical protein [Tanacetum cinerariifolium]
MWLLCLPTALAVPMETSKTLMKDENAEDVDVHLYRSMVGSLMYLTSSRPDIMFVFWATTTAKNINGEAQIHAKVDGKKVIISEATIRRDLKFEDEGGVDCLSNEVIFEQLPLMGLEKATTTATSLDAKHDRGNISKTQSKATPNELSSTRTSLGGGPRVLNLETTKTAQTKKISILKKKVKRLERKNKLRTRGLKRLYKVGLSIRLESSVEEQSLGEEDASKQGRNIADIDANAEITLIDETAKDQGRYDHQEMFDTSVLDDEEEVLLKEAQDVPNVVEKVIEDITTAGIKETDSTAALITTADVTPDELTMAQALVEIKKSKPKGTTTTTTVMIPTPDSTRPKARGVVMQEPSKTLTTTIPKSLQVKTKEKCLHKKAVQKEQEMNLTKKDLRSKKWRMIKSLKSLKDVYKSFQMMEMM